MKQTLLLITALFAFSNVFAQNRAGVALNTERLEKFSSNTTSKNTSVPDCNLNEQAKRHVGRAKGFMSFAENEADYINVLKEYKEAYRYAPNCPDICYNIAYCAELLCKFNPDNCDVAIEYYRKYLTLNPNASDKNEIEEKTYGLEAKKEVFASKELEKWIGKWEHGFQSFEIYLVNGKLKAKVITEWTDDGNGHAYVNKYQEIPVSINNNLMTFTYINRCTSREYYHDYHLNEICRLISTEKIELESHVVIYKNGTKVNEGITTDFIDRK